MGIFKKGRESKSPNLMLQDEQDPEKLVGLMTQEIEDTLFEMKDSCDHAMAACKKIQKHLEDAGVKGNRWAHKADLAVAMGRRDLAEKAILEKQKLKRIPFTFYKFVLSCNMRCRYPKNLVPLKNLTF